MKTRPDTIEYGILRTNEQGEETETMVDIWFHSYPGTPGTYWQPEEPSEVDIVSVTKQGTREAFEITEQEEQAICEYIFEMAEEYEEDV